ncbi:MAG: MFS transporter [Prevotella sp.]|nr:MFS transporter [Prevotella sp.]
MAEAIARKLNDSPMARWTVLFIVAFTMMMGYFINDVMSPLETLLETPVSEGGLGWSSTDYGFFSGSSSFINVFLLMLFFSGLILDRMGVRFTGVLACLLMIAGVLIKIYAITAPLGGHTFTFSAFNLHLPLSAALAALGFSVFGVGYEMCGITVSKVMVRWFTGYELGLAMGLQVALARLGTASALSLSAPVAMRYSLNTPLLVGLLFLTFGFVCYLVYCVMDRRLENENSKSAGESNADDSFRLSDIGRILGNPGFWIVTLLCMVFYSAVSPFLKFATKLMIAKYGVDADVAGFFTSIAPFGTLLLTPIFGSIYDKFGKGVTIIIIGTSMLTCVYIGFSLPIHASGFAIAMMILLSIAYSLVPSALWPGVPKMIPLKCLGTAYSMIFFIQNLGRSIVPMCVGKANALDPTYSTSMHIFAGLGFAAIGVAFLMLYVDKKKGYGLQLPNIKK